MADDFVKKMADQQRKRQQNGGSTGTAGADDFVREMARKQKARNERNKVGTSAVNSAMEAIGDRAVLDFIEKSFQPTMQTPAQQKQQAQERMVPMPTAFTGTEVNNRLKAGLNDMPLAMQGERSEEAKVEKALMDMGAAEQKAKQLELQVQQAEQLGAQIMERQSKMEQTYGNLMQLKKAYETTGDLTTGRAYLIAVEQYNADVEAFNKDYAEYQKTAKVYDSYNQAVQDVKKKQLDYNTAYDKMVAAEEAKKPENKTEEDLQSIIADLDNQIQQAEQTVAARKRLKEWDNRKEARQRLDQANAELEDLKAQRNYWQGYLEQKQADAWELQMSEEILAYGGSELMDALLDFAKETELGQRFTFDKGIAATAKNLQDMGVTDEQLQKWLPLAQRLVNEEAYNRQTEIAKSAAQANRAAEIALSVASVPYQLGSGAGIIDVTLQKLQQKISGSDAPVDYKRQGMMAYGIADAIRSGVSENIEKRSEGKWGSDTMLGNVRVGTYQLLMSMADSLGVVGLTAAGVPGATVLLGGSAATATMMEVKERGGSDAQALTMGYLAGAAETLFEEVSIDKLMTIKAPGDWKTAIGNILKQGLTEGTEEVSTTVANTLAEMIVMGDKNQLQMMVQEYMAQGISRQEAEREAVMQWGVGLLADFIGGAVSGGLFGAGSNVITADYSKLKTPKVKTEIANKPNTKTRKEVNDYVQQQDLKRAESSGRNSEWGASLDAEESNGNQPAAGAEGSGTVGESEINGYVENLRQQGRLRNASTASLKVDGGIETDDVGVIGIEDETNEMRDIRERGESMGVDTIFVTSAMTVESGGRNYRITGEHKGDRIIVQVNNKRMSMDQAAAHEMYHVLADKDPELVQRTRETLQTRYSQEQLNAMYQKYEAVYSDVYSRQEGMTDERVAQRIYEEMLADAYAEYGRFADQNAGLLTGTVREAARPVEEMAKSDIAAAQRELDTAVKKKTAADVETTTEQRMFQSMALDETIRGLVADRNDGVITQEEYQQKLAEYADKAYGNEASDTRVMEDQSRFALDEEADEQIVAEESESQEETKNMEKEPLLLEAPAEEEVTDGDSLTEAIRRAAGGYESFMVAQPKKVQELWNRKISNATKVLAKGMWTDPNEEFIAAAQEMAQAYMEQGTISTQMENDWFKSLYKLAPEHKGGMKAAKREYQANVRMMMSEFNEVRRYIKAKLDSEQTQKQEEPQAAELERLWQRAKQQRRAYERAAARNLLTEEDRIILGMLLKGETSIWKINPKKHNRRGIIEVYEAKQAYEDTMRRIRVYKLAHIQEMQDLADSVLMMLEKWKDKKSGLRYSKSTMERNIRDIAPNQEIADKVIEAYFQPVHKNEAKAIKLINRMRKRVKGLKLSNKESMAVQLMGEATSNVETLKDKPADTKRDGKTLEEWRQEIIKLKEDNPKLDWNKIDHAVAEFRAIYDELFQMQNEARVRNGYEPISYRKGYFPHFNNVTPDGILAAFGQAFGVSSEVTALPTTINGLTKNFKPGIRWTGHALERVTGETTLDAVEGFDRYIEAAADVIYHTDDIQRLRALANRIRYKASDQGLRDQIDEIKIRNISQAEKDSAIKQLYDDYGKHGRYSLSNFVVELEEYTNILANKKSEGDRITERKLGRSFYNASKAFEGRIAANMVAVNPASWLTNFIPITQAWGAVRTDYMIAGLGKTVWNDMKQLFKMDTDGIVDRSAFLTNRRGTERLEQNWTDKASKAMTSPMAMVDTLVSDTIVRARYLQNLKQGLSEDAALDEADAFAAAVIADRSKGALPTIFNEKNAVTKLLTTFQVEQINQFEYYFKDLPREARKRHAIFVVYMLAKVMLGAWWYNELYEKLVGRRPAFDPVGMVQSIFEDIAEGKDIAEVIMGAGGDALEQVPFVGGLMGGGRIPISSALPDIEQLIKAAAQPVDDPDTEELEGVRREEKLGDVFKELLPTIAYTLPPFGGGQVKKVIETLEAVKNHGSYSRSGELQYPVFVDDPKDLRVTLTTGLILGKSSLDEAVEWVDSDFKNLSERYTEAYRELIDMGVRDRDAWEFLDAMRNAEKTETESKATIQKRILAASSLPGDAKLAVFQSFFATDNQKELVNKFGEVDKEDVYNYFAKAGEATNTAEEKAALMHSSLPEDDKLRTFAETNGREASRLKAASGTVDTQTYGDFLLDYEEMYGNEDELPKKGERGYIPPQERAKKVIDAMEGLTKAEKTAIWQVFCDGAPANNPYDKRLAERIDKAAEKLYQEMTKETEDEGGIDWAGK